MIEFQNTPIEQYQLDSIPILVKREDKCGLPPLPPLSKIRGLYTYISRLAEQGVHTFGVVDTRISKSGQGVALICQALSLKCIYYFPVKKDEDDWLTEPRRIAQDIAGAELVKMPAGWMRIVYARAKNDCQRRGGFLLPLGFPVYDTVKETAKVVQGVEPNLLGGTILLSTGTGTILAGILSSLVSRGVVPQLIVGVSASMSTKKQAVTIAKHLSHFVCEYDLDRRLAQEVLSKLALYRGKGDYYTPATIEMPFPGHPYYEGKAWEWLQENLYSLPKPILFWNIGW